MYGMLQVQNMMEQSILLIFNQLLAKKLISVDVVQSNKVMKEIINKAEEDRKIAHEGLQLFVDWFENLWI